MGSLGARPELNAPRLCDVVRGHLQSVQPNMAIIISGDLRAGLAHRGSSFFAR